MLLLLIPILVLAVLLVLAVIVVVVVSLLAIAGAGISVLLGGIAAIFRPTRWVAPVFIFILPFTAVGGVLGLFIIGGVLILNAGGAIALLGPIIGLGVGLALGATVGTLLAVLSWSVICSNRRARMARA